MDISAMSRSLVWRGRGNGSKKQAEKSCLFLRRGAARGVPFRLARAEGRKYRVNKQERLVRYVRRPRDLRLRTLDGGTVEEQKKDTDKLREWDSKCRGGSLTNRNDEALAS